MSSERPSLYLDTSVVSVLTARPSRDIVHLARQETTREWWEIGRASYRVFISAYVIEEARRGDRAT